MNLLYPRIRFASLPAMLRHAAVGAVLAGCYGVVHDQVTYSISPEYFTRLKFSQFHWADSGLPPRVFAAEIGFLAACWVGFVAGWFLARVTVPAFPRSIAIRQSARGFLIIFACAATAAIIGFVLGRMHGSDYSRWESLAAALQITDLSSFVHVAYIHNASYLGGLIGVIAAIFRLRKAAGKNPTVKDAPRVRKR